MRFPLLTTFMPIGGASKTHETITDDHSIAPVDREGSDRSDKEFALDLLGLGSSPLKEQETPSQGLVTSFNNRYVSALPFAARDFAAQYPLTTVACIGAVSSAVLIGSGALTASLVRRAFGPAKRNLQWEVQEMSGQLADMERRLAGSMAAVQAELRILQKGRAVLLQGVGDKRARIVEEAVARENADKMTETLRAMNAIAARISSRLDESPIHVNGPSTSLPGPSGETSPDMLTDDPAPKPKKTTKSRKKKAPSPVELEEEERIMSMEELAEAIKGVQADFASYQVPSPEGPEAAVSGQEEGQDEHGADDRVDSQYHQAVTPAGIAQAELDDAVERSVRRAAQSYDQPVGESAEVVAEQLSQAAAPTGRDKGIAGDSSEPEAGHTKDARSPDSTANAKPNINHNVPRQGKATAKPAAEETLTANRKKRWDVGHNLYGVDDSGNWRVRIGATKITRRGWHDVPVEICYSCNGATKATFDNWKIEQWGSTYESSHAVHRIHYNPNPELVELDSQIWELEKERGEWVVKRRIASV